MKNMSIRGFVRCITFSLAAVLLVFGWGLTQRNEAGKSARLQAMADQRTFAELCEHIDNIHMGLQKASASASPRRFVTLASDISRYAGGALSCLAQLPTASTELSGVYLFISQVGDFVRYASQSAVDDQHISEEHRNTVAQLCTYASSLTETLYRIEDQLHTGRFSIDAVAYEPPVDENGDEAEAKNASAMGEEENNVGKGEKLYNSFGEALYDLEQGFADYPTLLYDGPFSEHLNRREALYLKDEPYISIGEARELAARYLAVPVSQLAYNGGSNGLPETYSFSADDRTADITMRGGLLCALSCNRPAGESRLSHGEAVEIAADYLMSLGIPNMKESYFYAEGGSLCINFAYEENGVLLYPDLIKVSVSLTDGRITGYEARGYLLCHTKRETLTPALTESQAASFLYGGLSLEGTGRLCLIPSAGEHELLCWEFSCRTEDGFPLLIYINAVSGAEEEILLLLESENGTLSR